MEHLVKLVLDGMPLWLVGLCLNIEVFHVEHSVKRVSEETLICLFCGGQEVGMFHVEH